MNHTTNLLKLGAFLVTLSLSTNLQAGAGGNDGGKSSGADGGGELQP